MASLLNIGRILSKPFQLHSQTTAIVLFLFGLLIGSKHLFGTSVHCSESRHLLEKVDHYKATPTLTEMCTADLLYTVKMPSKEHKSQSYYQFVYVALFAQAIACLVPALIWKQLENNRQEQLLRGLKKPTDKKSAEESDEFDVQAAAKYLKENSLGRCYLVNYVLCLLLCLVNLIGQIIFVNWFLGGDSDWFSGESYVLFGFSELFAENLPLSPRNFLFPFKSYCKCF